MKRLLIISTLILSGCAKVGDYQTKCEHQYPKFSDMAQCLDRSVQNDSRLASAASPKLYVSAAKLLGQGVDEGKISDAQARFELQNLYLNLQRQESADQLAQGQATQQALLSYQAITTMQAIEQKARQPNYTPPVQLQKSNVTTNCTTFGNQTNCQSY
ncbi:hypothetical protein [Escherichia coli]